MAEQGVIWAEPIKGALARAGGARFYRCAFQVNPFDYHERYGKTPALSEEPAYNEAIVEECLAQGIEVLAVTDRMSA